MNLATRICLVAGLATALSVATFAGPPGGGGHYSGLPSAGIPISGPAPLGASGAPPLGASGPAPIRGLKSAFRSPNATGRYATNRSYAPNSSGYRRGTSPNRQQRYDYRRAPAALFFAPYYYPELDYANAPYSYPGDMDYSGPPGGDPVIDSMMMAQGQLGQQVQRLTAEIEQLRAERQMQAPPYPGSESGDQEQNPAAPPVVLVLRNGASLQVQNYAVMNGMFWDFTKEPARKIALSEIDVEASTKATQSKGGEFPSLDATANESGN